MDVRKGCHCAADLADVILGLVEREGETREWTDEVEER
jgi:hypothetical protein